MEAESVPFSVGCLHFAPLESPAADTFGDFNAEDYVSSVRAALASVHTVDNIQIGHDNPLAPFMMLETPANVDFELGPGYFPGIRGLSVDFTIHVPDRVQAEIDPLMHERVGVEDYAVSIKYEPIGLPVTFIRPVAKETRFPANGFVLVRKYLQAELPTDSRLHLRLLGPSPFHADLFLVADRGADPATEIDFDFHTVRTPRQGTTGLRFGTTRG